MIRRTFLAAATAAALLPAAASAEPIDYTPGLVKDRLAAGDTVFLDFKASWCGTCRAQERVLNRLKDANPTYEAKVTFVNVDWDDYAQADLTRDLKIPRRSTLVVLKGDTEIGRLVAQTGEDEIKALMDAAVAAAEG